VPLPFVSQDTEHDMVVKVVILKYSFPLAALFIKAKGIQGMGPPPLNINDVPNGLLYHLPTALKTAILWYRFLSYRKGDIR
jgi:hypothetical protein